MIEMATTEDVAALRAQLLELSAKLAKKEQTKLSSDFWCSPPEVTEPLAQLFRGPADVDPCSNPLSIVPARVSYYERGLILPWYIEEDPGNQTAYKNPPYSKSRVWFEKSRYEMKIGHVEELVCLVMASTSTDWWTDACKLPRRNPRVAFCNRLKFLDPTESSKGMKRQTCRFEPALFYYGKHAARFDREFASIINWSTWGR